MLFCEKLQQVKTALESSPDDPPKFSLDGLNVICKCVHVYDGDTIHLKVNMGPVWGDRIMKCRMYGYDSSEVKGAPKDGAEYKTQLKILGHNARDYLKSLIEGKCVAVRFHEYGMYGRPLVDIYTVDFENALVPNDLWHENNYINQKMVSDGHGTPYVGTGVKKSDLDVLKLKSGIKLDDIVGSYVTDNANQFIQKLESASPKLIELTQFEYVPDEKNQCSANETEDDSDSSSDSKQSNQSKRSKRSSRSSRESKSDHRSCKSRRSDSGSRSEKTSKKSRRHRRPKSKKV